MLKRLFLLKAAFYLLILGALWVGGSFLVHKLQSHIPTLPDLTSEDIEDRFRSYATKITGKQSLYVAKLEQVEVFERTSKAKALWFELPSVIVSASAPVEYNYFVNLSGGWIFKVDGDELQVAVPELSSSTPAVRIDKLKFDVKKGSLIRDESQVMKRFEKELSGLLVDRAIANRELIREQARESIEVFVRTWVESSLGLQPGSYMVKVKFPADRGTEIIQPR